MDGLNGDSYDRKYTEKDIVKRIGGLFKDKFKKMIAAIFFLVVNTFIGIAIPIIISICIDVLNEKPTQGTVLIFIGSITVLGILAWVTNFIQKKYSKTVLAEVTYDIQNLCFRSTIDKDISFFDQNPTAKVISRITGDTDALGGTINLTIGFLKDILVFIVLIIVLFFKNPVMTLILIAFIPVIIGVSLGFRKLARKVSSRLFRAIAEVNQAIKESISGISITKNFRNEEYMYDSFLEVNKQTYTTNIKQGLVFSSILPIMNILSSLGVAIIVYFGAMKVMNGSLSFGALYLFIQTVGLIWEPVTSIASFGSQLQEGFAAAERIFSLLDTKSKVEQKDNRMFSNIEGLIEFKKTTIAYDRGMNILENFSLKIKPGEKIALIGHTGSGKTTIARLILRFYEFQEGQLLIDSTDIRSLNLDNYRKFIGYVGQTPFLFSGTVLENILYSNPEATEEDAKKAALSIGEGAWLEDLPEELNTNVGERGSKLSLGQKQLVALARIIVKKPSILILDEATASIDPITEHHVQEALKVVMQGRTSIVIAHRLSTVKSVDRLIVLSEGNIVEEGSHEKLLKEGTIYKSHYDKYFKHQSLEYIEKRVL